MSKSTVQYIDGSKLETKEVYNVIGTFIGSVEPGLEIVTMLNYLLLCMV